MSIDIKNFVEDCRSRGLTKQTTATYKSNITTYLNFVGNPLNVDISILCKFLDYLKEMNYKRGKVTKKGVHPRTIKAYFSAISTYYEYLVFTRQLQISPIPSFTKRYLSRIKQQYNGENSRQLISVEQMKQLINLEMPIQDKAILMILAKTGVRRGELLSMDLEDLNLEKKEIILKPKAKRTNRLVFFDDETAQVLCLFLEWRKARANSDALFISPLGFRMHKDDPNEIVGEYGSKLGLHDPEGDLNNKLTPHAFRHWFTTHLRRQGMPREMIQELRGDRRKETIDIYDHIDLSELKDRYFKSIPRLLDTPAKLHKTDLSRDMSQRILIPRSQVQPSVPYGDRSKAIYSTLKEHPEGLMIAQIVKLLKDKYNSVKKWIYHHMDSGNIQKDDLGRYSLTHQGYLMLGPSVDIHQVTEIIKTVTEIPNRMAPIETVTVTPNKAGRPKIISGFTVDLYEFVKNKEGRTTLELGQHFGKANDLMRPYLHRLKNYGYLINDNGKWYPASKEPIAQPHFIKINSTGQGAVLNEGIA